MHVEPPHPQNKVGQHTRRAFGKQNKQCFWFLMPRACVRQLCFGGWGCVSPALFETVKHRLFCNHRSPNDVFGISGSTFLSHPPHQTPSFIAEEDKRAAMTRRLSPSELDFVLFVIKPHALAQRPWLDSEKGLELLQ